MAWIGRHGSQRRFERAIDATVTPDGRRLIVTGSKDQRVSLATDLFVTAFETSDGHVRWGTRIGKPLGSGAGRGIAAGPRGNRVFVTGNASGRVLIDEGGPTSEIDMITVALRARSGRILWVRRYEGARDGRDLGHAIAIHPSGGQVFAAGESAGRGTGQDVATVAYRTA